MKHSDNRSDGSKKVVVGRELLDFTVNLPRRSGGDMVLTGKRDTQ